MSGYNLKIIWVNKPDVVLDARDTHSRDTAINQRDKILVFQNQILESKTKWFQLVRSAVGEIKQTKGIKTE